MGITRSSFINSEFHEQISKLNCWNQFWTLVHKIYGCSSVSQTVIKTEMQHYNELGYEKLNLITDTCTYLKNDILSSAIASK